MTNTPLSSCCGAAVKHFHRTVNGTTATDGTKICKKCNRSCTLASDNKTPAGQGEEPENLDTFAKLRKDFEKQPEVFSGDEPKDEQARLRKDIYDYLDKEGFKITRERHIKIKRLLEKVYDKRVINVNSATTEPVKHEITCPKCLGITVKYGKAFKNYKKRIDFVNKKTL